MELRQYFSMIRKWAWLIILMVIVTGGATFYYTRTYGLSYTTQITLRVGQLNQSANPTTSDINVTGSLAQVYASLLTQESVLSATAKATNYPGDWQSLSKNISFQILGTELIQITVTNRNPHLAKSIADELANQIVVQSPTLAQQKKAEDQRSFVNDQLAQLTQQIQTGQKSLNDLTTKADLENDPNKLKDLDNRITTLENKIGDWQKTYTSLSSILNSTSTNYVTILQPADEPSLGSGKLLTNTLLGGFLGLVLAGCAIFLLEFLDDTIHNPADVNRILNQLTLGTIPRIRGTRKPVSRLVTLKALHSTAAEDYRILRTRLHFAGLENPTGTLLVTSPSRNEGKSFTAANLAVSMAQDGKRVVLLDTDFRHPSLHSIFDLKNQAGLSSVLPRDGMPLSQVINATAIPGLRVVTSGPIPPNPTELLDSKKMDEVLEVLRAESDMVILDSPPVDAVADPLILGSHCSGALLVIDSVHTSRAAAKNALKGLSQSNIKVYGVALNKVAKPEHLRY